MNTPTTSQERLEGYRLSPQQEDLWLLMQSSGRDPYRASCTVVIDGQFDAARLRKALDAAVSRHEILRTSLHQIDGAATSVQVISESGRVSISEIVLTGSADAETEFADLCESSSESFSTNAEAGLWVVIGRVQNPPMNRVYAWERRRLACSLIFLETSALFTDSLGLRNLVREITAEYGSEPIQYADAAEIFNELIESEETSAGRAYWVRNTRDQGRHESIPSSRYAAGFDPSECITELTGQEFRELEDCSVTRRRGVEAIVLTAWSALLLRLAETTELTVGVRFDGRTIEGSSSAVGLYAKYLPIDLAAGEEDSFADLLERVAEELHAADRRQDYFDPRRHRPASSSRFLFEYIEAPPRWHADGAGFVVTHEVDCIDEFALRLRCVRASDALKIELHYDQARYDRESVQRLAGEFQTLLAGAVRRIDATIGSLEILNDEERELVVSRFNNTGREYDSTRQAHRLIEDRAAVMPDAIAVVDKTCAMSFGELDRRANCLAAYLQSKGVGLESCVGVCHERTAGLVVALLAIWKAGGAFLPLDPAYPSSRLSFILDDAGVEILIAQEQLEERLKELGVSRKDAKEGNAKDAKKNWRLLCDLGSLSVFARDSASLAPQSRQAVCAENLAYVIYTSGSTGRPKGVQLSHTGLINLVHWYREAFNVRAGDRATQIASMSFDASVWEIWPPLAAGATLLIIDDELRTSPAQLRDWLIENQATISFLPTPLAETMLSLEWPDECALRILQTAGDVLHSYPRPSMPFKLVNNYGPTENTVVATFGDVEPTPVAPNPPSIGGPVANVQVCLLDRYGAPVPMSLPGELCIGGAGLARGYRNRPDMTAEKFVPDELTGAKGSRLYKTGDLARRSSDGRIEFLGRIDHQVKIRGFRIELGEIETALTQHADIREAVVTAFDDPTGGKKLAAYVAGPSRPNWTDELRGYLAGRLPAYMIPPVFVLMDRLPLTANGKVDRKSLPAPGAGTQREYAGARNEIERKLVAVWESTLKITNIGINDSFFELGGDSILSMEVVARARQNGLLITPRQVFERMTIAELAQVATLVTSTGRNQEVVSGAVPLTPIQEWYFEQEIGEVNRYNQAVMLEVREEIDPRAMNKSVDGIVRHHDGLRLRFEEEEGKWTARNEAEEKNRVYVHVDLSEVAKAQQKAEIEAAASELQGSLSVREGPIVRVATIAMGEAAGRLYMTAHHLGVDGVSWRIVLEDLQRGYEQARNGKEVELGEKTTSYKEWAEKLREYGDGESVIQELSYWEEEAGREVGRIKADKEEGANEVGSEESVYVRLGREETRRLLQEGPRAYRSQINELLLSALVRSYERWSNEGWLKIEMEGHGREEVMDGVDVTRTAGWFTSVYPVVLEARRGEEAVETIKRVKEKLRRIPNKGIGYGLLRKRLANGAHLSSAQLSFNYLGQFENTAAGESLFSAARESAGEPQGLSDRRPYLIEVSGMVRGGQLQMKWSYSRNLHERSNIERFAGLCKQELERIIQVGEGAQLGALTPADYPVARLTQQELEAIVARYGEVEDIYPLSPLQEGMLFHTLYEGERGVYVEQMSCGMKGELSEEAFKSAWEEEVKREAIWRTAFVWEGLERPMQVVMQAATKEVELKWEEDWSGLTEGEQEARLQNYLREDRERGFDVSQAPLLRLALIRLAADRYRFVWTNHHLLLDGWSASIVIKEVFGLYNAHKSARQPEPSGRRPFRDYIAWLEKNDRVEAESYWKKALGGFEAPTDLRIERTSGAGGAGGYEGLRIALTSEATRRLNRFVQKHSLTMNTLVQGAWSIVMSRYSGEAYVVYGVTVAGRPPELEHAGDMVGLFINTLPFTVNVSPGRELIGWLREIQERQVEMRRYEYNSLAQLQKWAGAGARMFDSIFVFENYPIAETVEQGGVGVEIDHVSNFGRTNYGITVVAGAADDLWIRIKYDDERYASGSVSKMLEHLERILSAFNDEARTLVGNLKLLTDVEERQIVSSFDRTGRDFAAPYCVHELIEAHAASRPDAMAVQCGAERLSYGELNDRANRLAGHLIDRGAAPESVVGICVDRGVNFVVAVLAVLKAGAAYLPIDPDHPAQRIVYTINDANARLVLVESKVIESELKDGLLESATTIVNLDNDWDVLSRTRDREPASRPDPSNSAYVLYTSGSTGRPKGVAIEHRQLMNYTRAMLEVLPEGLKSYAMVSTVAADLGNTAFYPALCGGAVLHIVPADLSTDGAGLAEYLDFNEVECMKITPSHLEALSAGVPIQSVLPKRALVLGGEASRWEFVEALQAAASGCEILNHYGPTETTVGVLTCAVNEAAACRTAGIVPLGRPLTNARTMVLDNAGHPVAAGLVGELHVGGQGVARGYLNRPDLTAERFLPDPFSAEAGQRMYRTGDLVRHSADGYLIFAGRADEQVKIRGYRVELSEIQRVLEEHPSVRQAVVVVGDAPNASKQVIAYVVTHAEVETSELRSFVRERLPDYMTPSVFVTIDKIPLTANGKLDRQALPQPDRSDAATEYRAPRNQIEHSLEAVWKRALKLGEIGIDENFFELGGDSILSIQIVGQARKAGINLTLRALFEHPTLAELADWAGQNQPVEAVAAVNVPNSGLKPADVERINRRYGEVEDFYPLSPLQEGMLFHTLYEGERGVGSSRVDLQACKLEYSIVSPK